MTPATGGAGTRTRGDGVVGAEVSEGARLPRLLQAEPVSRHTRIVLWVLAGLMLVLEIVIFVFEPALAAWFAEDPAVQADPAAADLTSLEPRTGVGLVIRVGLVVVGVVATLLFAWQPAVTAALVLGASAVALLGLVGPDHPQLHPLSFSGGWVLGAPMVARYARRRFVWTAAAALVVLVVAAELLVTPSAGSVDLTWAASTMAVIAALLALPALLVRRARHQARDRVAALEAAARRARQAAEAERQRIATELHDVVAHGLTVISMQAAMLPTLTDPARRRGAEEAIEGAARQSLVDLRRMLTALRGTSRNEGTGEPDDVTDLPARVAEFRGRLRAAGYTVSGELAGLEELPESLRLTVLRVAQEGTTNILKHGPGAGEVEMSSRVDGRGRLRLRLVSPTAGETGRIPAGAGHGGRDGVREAREAGRETRGAGPEAREGAGREGAGRRRALPASGFGLAGMAERVSLFGGSISVGPDGDRWALEATLPTR
ncbi:sensor histidine kinase [Micrococcus sp.]|uniref:sensor histidine kinase n=1 Tax=Micrococcus sp. TaxID=1271 RepID=UPI002A914273|nr:histidine kinase [Micrococcus sp.]MDY6055028.1 histidine kinase [Micrococcus sp.]